VHLPWDADRYLDTGETLPEGALEDFRDNYSAIFIGAFGDPRVPDMKHAADILLGIRFGLDLYINLRPVKLYDEALCPLKGKTPPTSTSSSSARTPRAPTSTRRRSSAARRTRWRSRRRSTPARASSASSAPPSSTRSVARPPRGVHGRQVERHAHGHDLWQRVFAEVAAEYPSVETRHLYVDALTMQMVRKPETFDVIVTNNMFGDIVTDLGAALQGGLGVAASANLHPGRTSMFEPVHGSAPKYAGTGKANPVGGVLSAALMLDVPRPRRGGAGGGGGGARDSS
jgi:3-isopropylmalate dehydrogenase